MPLFGRRRVDISERLNGVVAAAQVLKDSDQVRGVKTPRRDRAWQKEIWRFRREVPELDFAGRFIGNAFMRLTLTVGLMDAQNRVSSPFDDEGKPLADVIDRCVELIGDLRGPIFGQDQIKATLGEHLFYVGESFLVGTENAQEVQSDAAGNPLVISPLADASTRQWEVLSTSELEVGENGEYKRVEQGRPGKPLPSDAFVARIYHPDKEWSDLADASPRSCVDTLERLVLNGRKQRSNSVSRLKGAGVYWIPDEITLPTNPEDGPQEGDGQSDPFIRGLLKHMTTPIGDRGSAAAVVPYVVRARGEDIARIRHDTFDRPADDRAGGERKELVEELANGLDMPLEVVVGIGRSNHWNAYQIDETLLKSHIEPAATTMVGGLTIGYLYPMLQAEGLPTDVEIDGRRYDIVVWYDASELAAHPNRVADATTGVSIGAVKVRTWRREAGFTEDDAPDEEELAERKALGLLGKSSSAPTEPDASQGQNPGAPAGVAASAATVDPAGVAGVDGAFELASSLARAAEPYVARVVERAGAKVKGRLNGRPDLRARLDGVGNGMVTAVLGRDGTVAIVPESDMVDGEVTAFTVEAVRWCRQARIDVAPDDLTDRFAALILERLYDPGRRIGVEDFLDLTDRQPAR